MPAAPCRLAPGPGPGTGEELRPWVPGGLRRQDSTGLASPGTASKAGSAARCLDHLEWTYTLPKWLAHLLPILQLETEAQRQGPRSCGDSGGAGVGVLAIRG